MLKRFGSCQKGAAAVEFALLLPVLVLITFGVIEFGLCIHNKLVLTNASREGARAGAVHYSGDIIALVKDRCNKTGLVSFDKSQTIDVTVLPTVCTVPGADIKVTVKHNYTFLVPLMFPFGTDHKINLEAVTVMRCE
jgi:Flp pilus assembly protein TadG